jgi:hypothetical protein
LSTITSLWDDVVVEEIDPAITFVAGEPNDVLVSGNIANQNFDSMKITVQFEDLLPADVLLTAEIFLEVDYQDNSTPPKWRRLPVYQSNVLKKSDQAPERILIMQKNMAVQNIGEQENIQSGNIKRAEVNRFQGTVPEATNLRARVVVIESSPGGEAAFASMLVSGDIELYNA